MRLFILLSVVLFSVESQAADLDKIIEALKYIESNNNPDAIGDNGKSFGILQIQKACVKDVNRRFGTSYRHKDMFNVECAEEVFKLYATIGIERYLKRYGKSPTAEVIVRNHNGGVYQGYKIEATKGYYRKYKKVREKLDSRIN
ncbi:lysozyme [Cellulophaga phage Calle_1]|uniref:Lysozyme n=1 Tax=Cellulophaga phage Calle_1 TaxID=2745643 RepID=A0A8E4ZDV9_9CAUD|nr:lysozyme [Cellulophaga phage Calle_1]QQV89760.1 lysozyme [Cellulophaga phage Calle_1]QQV89829.1 lysozyme [Cellulophaga phage Calle_2]QQV89890.1 lysozyme [Cellulophaga phage Calle_3]